MNKIIEIKRRIKPAVLENLHSFIVASRTNVEFVELAIECQQSITIEYLLSNIFLLLIEKVFL